MDFITITSAGISFRGEGRTSPGTHENEGRWWKMNWLNLQ